MMEKPEYIALIQPVPGIPEAEQRRLCAKFEPSDYFLIGKDGDHDAFLRIMRPPRVALVSHAGLLGEQRGKKLDRADGMASTKAALHKRGSHAVEASTGRSSLKKWAGMRKDGDEMCRRLSQGAKSALNGRKGTTPLADQYDKTALRDLLRVKVNKTYKNWRTRRAAIVRMAIKPVPGRTWFLRHLEATCRSRGILE